jgi:large-conductance mechanosensitive channel
MYEVEIFTIAMIASFATWKLLNTFYDNMYTPLFDVIVDDPSCDQYVLKIGKYHVKLGEVIKDLFKWVLVIIVLMICHNLINKHVKNDTNK